MATFILVVSSLILIFAVIVYSPFGDNEETTFTNLKKKTMENRKKGSSTTTSTTVAPVNPVPTTPYPPVYEEDKRGYSE